MQAGGPKCRTNSKATGTEENNYLFAKLWLCKTDLAGLKHEEQEQQLQIHWPRTEKEQWETYNIYTQRTNHKTRLEASTGMRRETQGLANNGHNAGTNTRQPCRGEISLKSAMATQEVLTGSNNRYKAAIPEHPKPNEYWKVELELNRHIEGTQETKRTKITKSPKTMSPWQGEHHLICGENTELAWVLLLCVGFVYSHATELHCKKPCSQ